MKEGDVLFPFVVIHFAVVFKEVVFTVVDDDAGFIRIRVMDNIRRLGGVEVDIDQGLGFGCVDDLMSGLVTWGTNDKVSGLDLLRAIRGLHDPFSADDIKDFRVAHMGVEGVICLFWRNGVHGHIALVKFSPWGYLIFGVCVWGVLCLCFGGDVFDVFKEDFFAHVFSFF